MNPYELPSYSSISEECLSLWGKPEFGSAFLDEMVENESDLPLDDMCEGGSYPSTKHDVYCTDLEILSENEGIVSGRFRVKFTQLSPTGCRDVQWKDNISGQIDFTLNLKDGEVKFEPPTVQRYYERDEF